MRTTKRAEPRLIRASELAALLPATSETVAPAPAARSSGSRQKRPGSLPALPKAPFWTADEDAFLRKHYPREGARYVAEKLGRPKGGVNERAAALGIRSLAIRPWTHKEEALLRLQYQKLTASQLAKRLNRSEQSVRHRIRKLGLNDSGSAPWTSDELAYLSAHYDSMSNAELARAIGRSIDAVELKAGRLGLSQRIVRLTPAQEQYVAENVGVKSYAALARELGVGLSAIICIARKSGHRARPTSRPWTASDDEELQRLMPHMTYADIGKRLDRTALAVKLRARTLGLAGKNAVRAGE
ncbi:MAG: HTH domain-containing protein [Bacteroidetes bacterium]|nr:HTH domain-containing protein [Bacteroidota bacterium]